MIKPLCTPQLSAARPRVGLQRASDLIPRLIRMYELQAELTKREIQKEVEEREAAEMSTREFEQASSPLMPADALASSIESVNQHEQATFGWYE